MEIGGIIVDTNAYAAFMRGERDAVAIVSACPLLVLTPIILGELLSGFALGDREDDNLRDLRRFMSRANVRLLPIFDATAAQYARLLVELRRIGSPIPTSDLWIAASAMEHGLAVYSFDAHFQRVPRLRVGTQPGDFGI